jgi:hypothetical protein
VIDDNSHWSDDENSNSCLPRESTSDARGLLHLGDVWTHEPINSCFRDTFSQQRHRKHIKELVKECGAVWQLRAVCNEEVRFGSMVLIQRDATPTAQSEIRLWFLTTHEFSNGGFVRARPTADCDWLSAFPAVAGPLHIDDADELFTVVTVCIAFPLAESLEPHINPVQLWSPSDLDASDTREASLKCWIVGFPSAPSASAVRETYAAAGSDVFAIGTVVLDEFHFGELFAQQFGGFVKQVVSIGEIKDNQAHNANSCGGMGGGAVLVIDESQEFRLFGLNIGSTDSGASSTTNRFLSVEPLRGKQLFC